jgi:hypothetical protein
MSLQLVVKKPPGDLSKNHPSEIVESLIGCQLLVATNTELREANRPELIDVALAVSISWMISFFKESSLVSLADYWEKYLGDHPSDKFLLFYLDEREVELSY